MLYVDLDHVLADFDAGYEATFGQRPDWTTDPVAIDWTAIAKHPSFWRDLPLLPDAMELWDAVKKYDPYVITSIPPDDAKASIGKINWVMKRLGAGVPVVCCGWDEKPKYCRKNDVLIDNWDRVVRDWQAAGGLAIEHKSAADTIAKLAEFRQYLPRG